MASRFHCSAAATKAARKSKHHVQRQCERVCRVLSEIPDYGEVIPGFAPLRKMRVHVPELQCGKSGGYRAIYAMMFKDEVPHIVFLTCYFKGGQEDLSRSTYEALKQDALALLGDPETGWD